MTSFTKVHQKRLLNVVRALRESPVPNLFTMSHLGYTEGERVTKNGKTFEINTCNTPACALGHYAARHDLQKKFDLLNSDIALRHTNHGHNTPVMVHILGPEIAEHFGIDEDEAEELFGGFGCGYAKKPEQAARYIERFVAKKKAKRA